jgi:hypothetical protein
MWGIVAGIAFMDAPLSYNRRLATAPARRRTVGRDATAFLAEAPLGCFAGPVDGRLTSFKCPQCEDTGWVCEDHPDTPWDGDHACSCGAAGMPCPRCNPSDLDHPPRRLPALVSCSIRRAGNTERPLG